MVLKFDRDFRKAEEMDSNVEKYSERYTVTEKAELRSPLFDISDGATYCFSLSWAMESQEKAWFGVALET